MFGGFWAVFGAFRVYRVHLGCIRFIWGVGVN